MAVKPLTQPLYWATDAVYSTGPFVGQPQKVTPPLGFAAEGHRPGALFPTPAEYENDQQYNLTGLARWVFAGSSTGAADAHVLETNAAGRTAATGLTINDTVDETAVSITAAATGANFGLLVSCTTGGTAIASSIGNASATNFLAGTGTGLIAEGMRVAMSSTPISGTGVRVNADATTAAPAFRAEHAGAGTGLLVVQTGSGIAGTFNASGGTGFAMTVFGNSSNAATSITAGAGQGAVQAIGGLDATAAVGIVGQGTSIGTISDGGSGSAAGTGLRGTATHADATGVHGRTSTSASTSAVGVLAEGRGSGTTGLLALNQVGRAAVFQGDASSPAYAATRWVPQDADPTSGTNDGEVFWHASHKTLRTSVAGAGWRSMPTLGPGSAFIVQATQATNAVYTATAALTTMLTAILDTGEGTGYYGAASNAKIHIKFSGEVRLTIGPTADTLNIRVIDVTNAAIIAEWSGAGTAGTNGFYIPSATLNWQRMVGFGVLYQPPGDGDITVTVNVSRVTNNLQIRNGTVVLTGTFA